ncbi:flavin reductase family protein [Pelagibacterium halotolerans]|uniref:flavin reductase family protein n=1 Tax=Pelagibacterium halotolerans TaxID=531813 RepID=UPI00384F24DE
MTDARFPSAKLTLADPARDSDALDFAHFADTMATLAGTVCIVTAGRGANRVGRTITSLISLSATPPSLLVSITKNSDLDHTMRAEGGFSVAMLATGQFGVSDAFAGQRPPERRFEIGTWDTWPSGRPKLADAATAIDCRIAGMIELDTHCLFGGVLINAEATGAAPLLWRERGYHHL